VTGTAVHVVHESHCPDIGPICAERPEPPQLHDQRFNLLELRLSSEYGLTDAFGVELQLPLKLTQTTVHYERLDGTPFVPDYPNIHHRDEALFGPGDPWLLGRFSMVAGRFTLAGKLGVSLPLGATEENPFVLGEMGLEHQHIQFGTGTFDPVAVIEATRPFSRRFQLSASGQSQLMLYDNAHGYRAGNRYAVGLQARFAATPKLAFALTTDLVNEQPERWDGVVRQDGNLGRTDVLVGAGASYPLGDYALVGSVRAPVYQKIIQAGDEAGQLSYPAIVELSLRTSFGRSR
jgi:Putative MetA-pathway of phenol degradation